MSKIRNYINSGKGIGALMLLLFSLITSLYLNLIINPKLEAAIPQLQQVADEMLPIKVEKGKVTVPENTIRETHLTSENSNETFSFVIDTTLDTLDTASLPMGIYLTRSNIYSVGPANSSVYKLKETFVLPKQDYTPALQRAFKWFAVMFVVFATVLMFLTLMLLNLFYTFCIGLATVVNKTTMTFDSKMRLNAVLLIIVLIISHILSYLGLNLSMIMFFSIMIVLQIVVVKHLGKTSEA